MSEAGSVPSAASGLAVVPRLPTIDLLRGFSILAVVLLHSSLWLSFSDYKVGQSFPKALRYVVFSNGGNGVSIFFAISGFLITLVSLRRFGSLGQLSIRTFYRMRFARIAPLLALLLVVLSVLHWAGPWEFRIRPGRGSLAQALFAALSFQLNWFEAVHGWLPACWTVLWSLSVEEMFYFFFPLLCVLLLRRRWTRPLFFASLCGLVVFGPFARTPWYTANDIWSEQSYLGNLDNIALGVLFAMLAERLRQSESFVRSRWPLVCQTSGGLLMLVVVCEWPRVVLGWHPLRALGRSGTDVTVLGLGTCLVMLGSVLRPGEPFRWTAPLRWLGRHSYEVYLSHEFVVIGVLSLFLKTRREPVALWVLATVLLAAGLGYLLSRFFSEPLNRALRGAPQPREQKPLRAA